MPLPATITHHPLHPNLSPPSQWCPPSQHKQPYHTLPPPPSPAAAGWGPVWCARHAPTAPGGAGPTAAHAHHARLGAACDWHTAGGRQQQESERCCAGRLVAGSLQVLHRHQHTHAPTTYRCIPPAPQRLSHCSELLEWVVSFHQHAGSNCHLPPPPTHPPHQDTHLMPAGRAAPGALPPP